MSNILLTHTMKSSMHKKGSAPHESESLNADNVAKNFRIHLEVHFGIIAIKCDPSSQLSPMNAIDALRKLGRLNVFDQKYRNMAYCTRSVCR